MFKLIHGSVLLGVFGLQVSMGQRARVVETSSFMVLGLLRNKRPELAFVQLVLPVSEADSLPDRMAAMQKLGPEECR